MPLLRELILDGTGISGWYDGANPFTLQVESGSETGTHQYYNKPDGIPGFIDRVQDPIGERGIVTRLQLEYYKPETSGGNRAQFNAPAEPAYVGAPVIRRYDYDILIPDETEFRTVDDSGVGRYFVVSQLKHTILDSVSRWPNTMIWAGRDAQVGGVDQFVVTLPVPDPPATATGQRRQAGVYPLIRNRWYTISSIYAHSQNAATGWLRILIDGQIVVNEFLRGNDYVDVVGSHFVLGMYNTFRHTENPGPDGRVAKAYYANHKHYSMPFTNPAAAVRARGV